MRLKIKEGEHIPPEIMRLLGELAGHRDVCEQCERAMKVGDGRYCPTGSSLVMELAEQPGVDFKE